MFGKSFSNEAVEIAVKYIRLFDDNPDALFDLHEPQQLTQSWPNPQNEILDFRDIYNNDPDFNVRLSFGLGLISEITQHFFDGKTKHMGAYEKAVVISAFNCGFLVNEGKYVYRTYSNPKYKGSQFYRLGQLWGKKYYIDKFIQSGMDLNEATKLLQANILHQEMKFYDPERALEIASEAKIPVKEHLDWCNSFVLRIEKEFENNGEFNADFLSYLSSLEGNLDSLGKSKKIYYISSNYTIEKIYRAMNKILSREMHPELVEFFDNGYTCAKVSNPESSLGAEDQNYLEANFSDPAYAEKLIAEDDHLDPIAAYAPQFNIEKRYTKYLELWGFEQSRPQSKIFNEAFSDRISKLDFENFDFRKTEEGQFKEALKINFNKEDLEFILEIFGSIYHLLKDQNINVKIRFTVPCDPVVDDEITSYPLYKRQPFFGLKNKIIANENNFSFSMVGQNFPIFGRSFVQPNLSLNIYIEFETDDEWHDLMYLNLKLASKFTQEEILDKDGDHGLLYLAQELKSISRELEGKFNPGQNRFKRLCDLIEDWKSVDYFFEKNEREVYNFLMANSQELTDHKLQQDALHFLDHENFIINSYSPSDINWDAVFSLYSDSNKRRSKLMDEHGWFYDDFELEQLERFSKLGVPINPQQLRKGLGVLPVSIKIAMRMERLFAKLGDKHYVTNNFKNLLYKETSA
jgi:hypothetical protein